MKDKNYRFMVTVAIDTYGKDEKTALGNLVADPQLRTLVDEGFTIMTVEVEKDDKEGQ